MRQIKFRVWDSTPTYELMTATLTLEEIERGFNVSGKHRHVMQFTGLTDKNGKEIYEGDILKDPNRYPRDYEHALPNQMGVAHFDVELSGYYVVPKNMKVPQNNPQTLQVATSDKFEIIGNIYESPEVISSLGGSESNGVAAHLEDKE